MLCCILNSGTVPTAIWEVASSFRDRGNGVKLNHAPQQYWVSCSSCLFLEEDLVHIFPLGGKSKRGVRSKFDFIVITITVGGGQGGN